MKSGRRMVAIEVVGPVEKGYVDCRRCGGEAWVYHIVGLAWADARYWECGDCGKGEVVKGTPMDFGELPLKEEDWERLHGERYRAYRRDYGLPDKIWLKEGDTRLERLGAAMGGDL